MADAIHAVSAKRILILVLILLLIPAGNYAIWRHSGDDEERKGAVCFALDCSVSMAGEELEAAKEELRRLAVQIPSGVQMSLVSFRRDAEQEVALTESRAEVIGAAENLTAAGKTGISEGLKVAAASLDEAEGEKIVLLFTDGRNGEERIGKEIREELRQRGIILSVIGMVENENGELLDVAKETGGSYRKAADGGEMELRFHTGRKDTAPYFAAAVLESLAAVFIVLITGRKKAKKRQRNVPLPNAGYLKKEEIRKIL